MENELEQLRARVAELEFHFNEIRLELERYALSWPFHLSPLQGVILGLFLKHKNRVLTKEVIWRYIWGMRPEDEQPEPKIVDVYICKIRAVLRRHDVAIETMWGRGYLIDDENHAKLLGLTKTQPVAA